MKKHISIFLVLAAVATVCWSAAPKGYNRTVVSGGTAETDIIGEVKIYESLTDTSESFNIKGGTATLTQIKFGDGTTMETAATGTGGGVSDHDALTSTGTMTHADLEAKGVFNDRANTISYPSNTNASLTIANENFLGGYGSELCFVIGTSTSARMGYNQTGGVGLFWKQSTGYGLFVRPEGGLFLGTSSYPGGIMDDTYGDIGLYVPVGTIETTYGIKAATAAFTGDVTATAYYGDGSNLTGIAASGELVSPSTGIIAGTLAADVVAQSLADSTDYDIPASSITVSQITVDSIVTPGATGSITGDITEISTVTYARINTIQFEDGTIITSSATLGGGGTGDGDFLADGTVPMTGDLDLGEQNIVNASSGTFANGLYASEFYLTQKATPSKLSFWEGSGSGTNKLTIQSSTTLAGDVTFTLPAADGSAGHVLKTDGSGALYFGADATGEAGSEFLVSPSTGILAGTLASDVIASSIAINAVEDASIVSISASKVSAGSLGASVIASSIAVNSVHNEMITAVGADKINAGSLGASVIASSVAVNSVGITAIQATGASGYLNHDGTWSTPEAASVAANEITGGTCDTDVIVSSIGVNALSGFTGQVASNGRKLMDQYAFSVCISTPYALGTSTFSIVSVYFPCDITISTITARVVGGTNAVVTFSHRADSLSNATNGTAILTGNVTATETVWTGGTLDDATIPAGSAIAVKFVSFSGNVDRILIKGMYVKD